MDVLVRMISDDEYRNDGQSVTRVPAGTVIHVPWNAASDFTSCDPPTAECVKIEVVSLPKENKKEK